MMVKWNLNTNCWLPWKQALCLARILGQIWDRLQVENLLLLASVPSDAYGHIMKRPPPLLVPSQSGEPVVGSCYTKTMFEFKSNCSSVVLNCAQNVGCEFWEQNSIPQWIYISKIIKRGVNPPPPWGYTNKKNLSVTCISSFYRDKRILACASM